jgi:hypothetical protein
MRMVLSGTSRMHTPAFMMRPGTSTAGRVDLLASRRLRQLLADRALIQAKLDHLRAHRTFNARHSEAS